MAQQDMHDDPQQLELLRVARIGRAQGLKGEVTVRLYTDDPEWRLLYSQDGETEYIVEGSRTFKDRWILKLEGVDDRNAAEALNGVELYGEVDDAEDMLEADEWYPKDLIGLEARLVEGNGLGLAIVSTYTAALGGDFDIAIDCDQFKARISFPLPEEAACIKS